MYLQKTFFLSSSYLKTLDSHFWTLHLSLQCLNYQLPNTEAFHRPSVEARLQDPAYVCQRGEPHFSRTVFLLLLLLLLFVYSSCQPFLATFTTTDGNRLGRLGCVPPYPPPLLPPEGVLVSLARASVGFGFTYKAVFTVCCGADEYSFTIAWLSLSP